MNILCVAILLGSCDTQSPNEPSSQKSQKFGNYEITFDLGEVQCPTRWDIRDSMLCILNADERIIVSDYKLNGDSGSFMLPVFNTTVEFTFDSNSTLTGVFKNQYRKGDYKIAFNGKRISKDPMVKTANLKSTYDVTMDSGEDAYKAIGIFNTHGDIVTGTFLTETGDYRFLEGRKSDENSFYLSCFDGSHLFYFTAELNGDSVSGKFYSGNHWNTTWKGVLDSSASLADPNGLTYLNEGETAVDFFGFDMNGDSIHFDSKDFTDVTMIQILGTWCPNCMDETAYYSQLDKKYGEKVDIIGLAFERPGENSKRLNIIKEYQNTLDISYPVYLSGDASKSLASEMFSELNGISSFPTTIFLDKHGMVRKIHTGFYGPGTGEYYTNYTQETESFLDQLIAEK